MRIPYLISAALLATTLAACDRGPDANESDASRYTRNGPDAKAPATQQPGQPAAQQPGQPAAQPPAPRPTLAPASSPMDSLSDTAITGKIKAAILSDPGMTGADVTVSTDHGVVVLSGMVKAQEQIAIASGHAQRQDGVMRVDNQLAKAAQ